MIQQVIVNFQMSIYDIPAIVGKSHPQVMILAHITSDLQVSGHQCVNLKLIRIVL